jgi:hypothetical protein
MKRLSIASVLIIVPLAAAQAQAISLDDLRGATIHTVNTYSGNFRSDKGTAPGRVEVRREARIGQDGTITWSFTRSVTADGAKGTKTGQLSGGGSGKLGTPQKAGDGNVLWIFEGNSLVRMRTYESGGHLQRITFARAGGGLTCTSDMPLVREMGGGNIKGRGAIHSKIEILETRQTGSSCRVSKP